MQTNEIKEYLERIHYHQEVCPDKACLDRLMQAHLTAIPFENLEVYEENKVPSLEIEDIFDKIVRKKRGGYCFELNRLFYELLAGIGFDVYPVGIRIVWQKPALPPMLHRGTIVRFGEKKYLCDVGYGGPGPRTLLAMADGEYESGSGSFRVSRTRRKGGILIERLHEGAYSPLFYFQDEPAEEADFITMNYYCAKSDQVIFTKQRMVNLCLTDGSAALTGRTLTVREGKKVQKTEYASLEELTCCLKERFGIVR